MKLPPSAESYQASLEKEKRLYENCLSVHELPDIFHYWSNRYVRPILARLGFGDAPELFLRYLDRQCRSQAKGLRRFAGLGAGNCDLEIQLARELCDRGHVNFLIDCIEVNPAMLERARVAANYAGVASHVNLILADLNSWEPSCEYHAVMAYHSLHHIVNLEGLFDGIGRSLQPRGSFLISDMIGRNGHQRWPEALEIVQEFWKKLPPSYRFHRLLNRYEETFENRDCSLEGFEGVRSQDILPLLIDRFHFEAFVGFANAIDPFVDRGFGPNFNAQSAWDRNFIDEIQRRDERELSAGRLKPTHMIGVVTNQPCGRTMLSGNQSPRSCVRAPRPVRVTGSVDRAYEWGSWPHPAEEELQIACTRLAQSADVIRQMTERTLHMESELQKRTEWALGMEAQLGERAAWASQLQQELSQHERWISSLRRNLDEKSAWASNLEAGRVRFEKRIAECGATITELETKLDARSAWALRLQAELDEKTRRVQSLENQLRSYLHNPLRFLARFANGIRNRLKSPRRPPQ